MSDTQIDERIVSLEFDNKEFEKNVQKSLTTLERLKLALKFDKSYADAFKGIEQTSKKVSFEGLNESIETVKNHFSALEIMGVTALMNITNHAIDTGRRMVKALSVDQVAAGFNKYAEKTSSVQTIINSTGKSMQEVSDILEKLNWFTDETSYNFLDMVNNIGKFTSNRIELEKAETAMEGIATWAAISGANSQSASRAMYNISQSISQGSMKLMDWMSIENANMATAEFKQTAIETAAALGTLKKDANGVFTTLKGNVVTVENFRTTLSDAWFTSEAIMQSLSKYGGFAGRLYDVSTTLEDGATSMDFTATKMLSYIESYKNGTLDLKAIAEDTSISVEELTEMFDELSSDTYELGRKSFKAAQEAKTFSEALDATKDAVSTGWMNIFEQIFGTYEEAKQLWTGVANLMYDMFAAGLSDTADLLKQWKELGGRRHLLDAFANSLTAILNLLAPIKQAFRDVFPETQAQTLVDLTKRLADFTARLTLSSQTAEDLRIIFTGLFSILKGGLTILSSVMQLVPPAVTLLRIITSLVLTLGASVTNLISPFVRLVSPVKIISTAFILLKISALALVGTIGLLVYGIRKLVYYIRSIPVFGNIFTVAETAMNKLVDAFKRFVSVKISDIPKFFSNIVKEFNKLKSAFINSKFIQTILTAINGELVKLQERFSKIAEGAKRLATGFSDIGKSIKDAFVKKDASSFADILLKQFTKLKKLVDDMFGKGLNIVNKIFGGDEEQSAIEKLRNNMKEFVKYLQEFTASIGPARLSALALSVAFIGLAGSLSKASNSLADAFVGIKGFFGTMTAALRKIGAKSTWVKDLGFAIGMVAASLFLLAKVPTETLLKNTAILGGFIAIMIGLTTALEAFSKKLGIVGPAAQVSISNLGVMFMSLGASVAILTVALKVLENVDITGIGAKVLAIGGIMFELALVTAGFGRIAPKFKIGAFTMLIVSGAVANVVRSLEELNSLKDMQSIKDNILLLSVIMAGLGLFAKGLGSFGLTSGLGIIILVKSIDMIVPALQKLSGSGIEKLIDKVIQIVGKIKDMYIQITQLWLETNSESLAGKVFGNSNLLAIRAVAFVGTVAIVSMAFDKISKGLKHLGIAAIAIAASLYLITYTFKKFQDMDLSAKVFLQAQAFISEFGKLIIALVAVAGLTHRVGEGGKMANIAATILSMTVLMTVATALMKSIGKLDFDQISLGVAGIYGIVGAMALLMTATSLIGNVNMGTVIALMIGMSTIFAEAIIWSTFSWNEVAKGITGAIGVAGALSLVMFAISEFSKNADGKAIIAFGTMILLMATSLVPAATAIQTLAKYKWDDLKYGLAALGLTLVTLSAVLGIMAHIFTDKKLVDLAGVAIALVGSLIAVTMAMTVLFASINEVSKCGWDGVLPGLEAMQKVLLTMGAIMTVLEMVTSASGGTGVGVLLAVAASMIALGASMALAGVGIKLGTEGLKAFIDFISNNINPDKAIEISESLTKLSDGLAIAGVILSAVSLEFVKAATSLLYLSAPLLIMKDINIAKMAEDIKDFSVAAVQLSAASMTLGVMNPALSKFSKSLPKLSKNLDKFGKVLKDVNPRLYMFTTIAEKAMNVAKDFGQGLVNGLKFVSEKMIWDPAVLIGKTIVDAVMSKDGLDEHSPSKKAIWIAKMFGVGIVEGMETDADVYKAVATKVFGSDMVDSVKNFWETSDFSGMFGGFTDTVEKLTGVSGLANLGYDIGQNSSDVKKVIDQIFGTGNADDKFGELADTIKNAINLFAEFDTTTKITAKDMNKNLTSQLEGMVKWKEGLLALIERGISPELYEYLVNMGQQEGYGYVMGLVQGTDEELQHANNLYMSYINGLVENTATELKDGYQRAAELSGRALTDGIEDEVNSSEPDMTEYNNKLVNASTGAIEQMAEATKPVMDKSFNEIFAEVGESLVNNLDGVKILGVDFGSVFAKNIASKEVKDEVKTSSKELGDEVKKYFDKNLSSEKTVSNGANLLRGIATGATKELPKLLTTMGSVCTSVLTTMAGRFRINSPSKATAEMGKYLMFGLGDGIDKNLNYVIAATDDMGKRTLNNMSEVLNNLNTYISDDMNFDPVVRPVLDVSNLESGASQIASIFNGRYTAGLAASTNRDFNRAEAARNTSTVVNANNSDVVSEISALRNDINVLGDAMSNLKVVMNGDAVVGEIAPSMDTALGTRSIRNRREK